MYLDRVVFDILSYAVLFACRLYYGVPLFSKSRKIRELLL